MDRLSDEQRLFFETNGYLMLPETLMPAELAAVRRAADDAEERWRRTPGLLGCRIPEFLEIEGIMEYHPLLFDLAEHPRVLPLVREVGGPDVALLAHASYIRPAGGVVTGSAWHTDVGRRIHGVYHPRSTLMVRVMFALEDVDEDGGATLVLP